MTRLLARALAAALVVAGVALALVAPAAAQVQLDRHGWWYMARQQPVHGLLPVPAPAPPTVPERGLYVASSGPGGAVGISAVRFHAPGVQSGTLTLTLAPGASPGAGALILACATTSPWAAAQGGAWEARPVPECAAAGTAGVVSADGTQVSWGLGPGHKQGDAFDVVLTPAPGATAPFQAPFQEPTAQTFAPAAGLGAPPPAPFEGDTGLEFLDPPQPADAPVSDVPAFGPQPFDAPAFDAPAFDVPAFGVPGFNMPPFNAPAFNVPALEPPGGPDAPGDDMAALAPPGDQQGREVPVEAAAFSAERIVALVILGLLAVWLWHLSGVQEPQPRLIGGLARAGGASPNVPAHSRDVKPVLGGVGRFARQRARMPTRL